MTVHALHADGQNARERLLGAVNACMDDLSLLARSDDVPGTFPTEALARLRAIGLLGAVLPVDEGGAGLGIDRQASMTLYHVLTRLGAAHLSLARLFEGHVNAFALLWHHGSTAQRQRLMRYVRDGGLTGVWNAPAPEAPLRLLADGEHFRLSGSKIYASGAGIIQRPLLTATTEDGKLLMIWCDVGRAVVDLSGWRVHGMRATATGTVKLDGVVVEPGQVFGADQDYHRQPVFSGGAWRFVAAQLGAAGALADLMKQNLVDARRDADPHQRARLAEAVMRVETGRLWTQAAARMADDPAATPADVVSYVGMARLVVEEVATDVIQLAQRSIGLRALHQDHPVERICRDLATYLKQPVPDAIRDAAGASAAAYQGAALDRWPS